MIIPIGIVAASGAAGRWAALYGAASGSASRPTITAATATSVYAFGDSSTSELLTLKYNNLGEIQWQRLLSGASSEFSGNGTADSSENVYICGRSNSQVVGGGATDLVVAKYNASGTLQWQRALGGSENELQGLNMIRSDGSGNAYIATPLGTGGTAFAVIKLDSSGALQWQKRFSGYTYQFVRGLFVSSSGDSYITGVATGTFGNNDSFIVKLNSSGVIQWQRVFGDGLTDQGTTVSLDSSNNVYVTGSKTLASTVGTFIVKYDSSGTLQWQRLIPLGEPLGSSMDSANNLYVISNPVIGPNFEWLITKINSSGTLQWQRSLGTTNGEFGYGISVGKDPDELLYMSGFLKLASGDWTTIVQVPKDGSGVGSTFSYDSTTVTYASSSIGLSTPSYSSTSGSFGTTDYTVTSAAGTFTGSTPTAASVKIQF